MLMESSSVRDYQKSFDQYLPVPDELFAMSHSEDIEFATSSNTARNAQSLLKSLLFCVLRLVPTICKFLNDMASE